MRRTIQLSAVFAIALVSATSAQGPERYAPPPVPLPASAERAYAAIAPRVDGAAAMDVVRFMDQYWRIAGNPGFT